ncbi:MAG: glycosyltransferase [Nitrosopumilus sp.]
MQNSIKNSPTLDRFEKQDHHFDDDNPPKVSIIIPARNEEKNITKCLDSLIRQDYANYEIIVVDDSSSDTTSEIISKYSKKDPKIIPVYARPKPDGWMGKNWACMEGYKKITGELLLFTDADTVHSCNVVTLAVSHLFCCNLDALTVIPRVEIKDFWMKITVNVLGCMSNAQFSPIQVNNPSKKIGLFYGSFFILKQKTYEDIGTHSSVKSEIIEDGELGQKTKDLKYKMKMVRGEHLVDAVFGEKSSVWQVLNRVIIPSYLKKKKFTIGMSFAAFLFLLFPFLILGYSVVSIMNNYYSYSLLPVSHLSLQLLFIVSVTSSLLIFIAATLQSKKLFGLKIIHGLLAPIGSTLLVLGVLNGILRAKSNTGISWKQRRYYAKDHNQ